LGKPNSGRGFFFFSGGEESITSEKEQHFPFLCGGTFFFLEFFRSALSPLAGSREVLLLAEGREKSTFFAAKVRKEEAFMKGRVTENLNKTKKKLLIPNIMRTISTLFVILTHLSGEGAPLLSHKLYLVPFPTQGRSPLSLL